MCRWRVDAGHHAQQGAFAGAVVADEAQAVAALQLEAEVVNGAHHDHASAVFGNAVAAPHAQHALFERLARHIENGQVEVDVLEGDAGGHDEVVTRASHQGDEVAEYAGNCASAVRKRSGSERACAMSSLSNGSL
jgi:hypothetical protein